MKRRKLVKIKKSFTHPFCIPEIRKGTYLQNSIDKHENNAAGQANLCKFIHKSKMTSFLAELLKFN